MAAAMSAIKEHMVSSINEENKNKNKEKDSIKTRECMNEKEQQKAKLKISMNHFEAALQKIKKKNRVTILTNKSSFTRFFLICKVYYA